MRTVTLAPGLETTALGLGCADLFREPSRAGRRRLLETALDAGIRHFDAAPMYGLGLVERELGRFARGRRDRIVIGTKFGIDPTPAARVLGRVQGSARRTLAALPALQGRARPEGGDPRSGAVGTILYRAPGYDAAAARASLERSLRELGTDHVDLLFLHDPRPGDVRSDDVRAYLESARDAGRLRAWGVAGEPEPILEAATRLGGDVPVLQLRDDIFLRTHRRLGASAGPTILFGLLARALPRIAAHVRSDRAVRSRWNDATGVDCSQPGTLALLLLRDGLRESRGGPILFSTTKPGHIEAAVAAAEADSSTDAALDAFCALAEREVTAAAQ